MKSISSKWARTDHLRNFFVYYDNKTKILRIHDANEQKFSHELSIEGLLLISTNDSFAMINIELMLPMSKWKRSRSLKLPDNAKNGRIFFPDIEKLCLESFEYSVFVEYDRESGIVRLVFDNVATADTFVRFSNKCIASFRHDHIISLYIYDKKLIGS